MPKTSSARLFQQTFSDTLIKKWSRKLRTPKEVQQFLRALPYNRDIGGATLRSAESSLRAKTAHCLEAAFIAAAILEPHGYPPLVMSFESRDGLDHVIFVFREKRKWGAIARSRDEGLHGRPPIYRSLRDLALSYYDPYVDKEGEINAYQLANLDDSKADWRLSRKNVWKTETYLLELKHRELKISRRRYRRLKRRYLAKGPLPPKAHWW